MINRATATPVIITNFFIGQGLWQALKFQGYQAKNNFRIFIKIKENGLFLRSKLSVYGFNILVAFFRGNRTFYFSHSLALDLPEQDGEQKQAR